MAKRLFHRAELLPCGFADLVQNRVAKQPPAAALFVLCLKVLECGKRAASCDDLCIVFVPTGGCFAESARARVCNSLPIFKPLGKKERRCKEWDNEKSETDRGAACIDTHLCIKTRRWSKKIFYPHRFRKRANTSIFIGQERAVKRRDFQAILRCARKDSARQPRQPRSAGSQAPT